MIRVCVVEDQMLVRQGLCSLLALADGIEVAGEAADGLEALEVIPKVAPDVVLLDLRMPELDGLGVLRQLGERGALPPALILTTFNDHELVLEGIRLGARGFLLKDVSLEQLTDAIRTLASGSTLINPAISQRIAREVPLMDRGFDSAAAPPPLTERETQILRMIAGGYSNREIAEALSVAEGTVKNHISNLLAKLGVRDRTRAVLLGIELGVI